MLTGSCHCGAVKWTYSTEPARATACNCSVCVRYGVLWIYGHVDDTVTLIGPTRAYVREHGGDLEFLFCPTCGNCAAWRAKATNAEGRTAIAVNLRLSDDPDSIGDLPIRHFDGAGPFEGRPDDGKTVKDLWF